MDNDNEIKFPEQHEFGRKELDIAEVEMPGLMGIRKEFGPGQVLRELRFLVHYT